MMVRAKFLYECYTYTHAITRRMWRRGHGLGQQQQQQQQQQHHHSPSIQFTSKAAVLGLARKELGHDRLGKDFTITNNKGLAVGQPANGVGMRFFAQNLMQTHGKDLGIIVFLHINVFGFLLIVVAHGAVVGGVFTGTRFECAGEVFCLGVHIYTIIIFSVARLLASHWKSPER